MENQTELIEVLSSIDQTLAVIGILICVIAFILAFKK